MPRARVPPSIVHDALRWLAGAALAVSIACDTAAAAPCPPTSTIATHVYGGGLCLLASTFGAESAGDSPVLIVVVHGDISDFGAATYHVELARALAQPGVVSVALFRPGYFDAEGRSSDGSTLGRHDNYTPAVTASIAAAIKALRDHYRARRVIYAGHSGGAAIGGVLIGRKPGLIDAAVLAACPCDIARWLHQKGRAAWSRSVSPADVLHRVPQTTSVVVIAGVEDDNTFPALARDFAAELVRRGVPARYVEAEGAGHGFSGLRAVLEREVGALIGR